MTGTSSLMASEGRAAASGGSTLRAKRLAGLRAAAGGLGGRVGDDDDVALLELAAGDLGVAAVGEAGLDADALGLAGTQHPHRRRAATPRCGRRRAAAAAAGAVGHGGGAAAAAVALAIPPAPSAV